MVFKWLFGPRSQGGGAIEDNAEFERAQARELLKDKQIPIRILTNTLRRQSNKARLAQVAAEKEMAKLIRESQMERAALLAEHAVQQKKLSLRLLSLSLKMKTVETMVDSAIQSSHVSDNIVEVLSLTESLHMDAIDIDQVERALKNINQVVIRLSKNASSRLEAATHNS